jgi:TonB-dependent receptor
MKIFNIFLVLSTLLILGASSLFAQESGQISGVVTDSISGDVLIGANVTLKGTSLGASTDIDGKYTLRMIPPGSYILMARYIGYKGQEIPIEIKSGAVVEKNFSLQTQAIEGQVVEVLAQARGQRSAINQQITSNTISNIVSSERIRELPDASAAAAISRLPGVSLMNGDQVVIRGVQAKLNTVLINGIQLPSTDLNNRSTNLGFISSNMLSGIEVTKTLTPDMDANTIGGVVNLKLREAQSGFNVDVFLQGSLNNQDKTYDNYKSWVSVSDRFFNDKFGVFIQANADRTNGGGESASATYAGVNANNDDWNTSKMTSFRFGDDVNITTNNGGSIILDYLLPHGKVVLQNTYAHNLNNNITYQLSLQFDPNNVITYNAFRNKYARDIYINALQTEYSFGEVKAEFTASHSFTNQYTYIRYGDAGDNFAFTNPWHSGLSTPRFPIETMTPEDVYKIPIDPTNVDSSYLGGWIMARSNNFYQHLYNTSLDITVPVSLSKDVSSKFKVGGKFYRTTRNNDVTSWYTGSSDPDTYDKVHNFIPGKYIFQNDTARLMFGDIMDRNYLQQRGQYFLGGAYPFKYALDRDKYDAFLTLSKTGWVNPIHYANSWRNDFNGAEVFSSGYIMGTFDVGSKWTIIAGGRFEHYNMKYKANWDYITHSVYGDAKLIDSLNTVDRNDDDFFPNAQIRYKATDWADIRIAYSKGISRPDYNAIVPRTAYATNEIAECGNTKLKPTLSTNYDLAVSIYSDKIGLLTISPFYKVLDDMFYQTSVYYKNIGRYNISFPDSAFFLAIQGTPPGASQKVTSYVNNTNPGYLKGVEIDWQTNFWYLPKPLNALVLNINYTRTWSDMAYNQVKNTAVLVRDSLPPHRYIPNYLSTDTTYHARLLYQADNVINIALGIDYKDFSGRISFNMQGNVITYIDGTVNRQADRYTGNVYQWDFTLQQKLPIQGLSVMLSGVNIFHNPVYTYQKFKKTGSTEMTENLQSTTYWPSIFELTLRYTM